MQHVHELLKIRKTGFNKLHSHCFLMYSVSALGLNYAKENLKYDYEHVMLSCQTLQMLECDVNYL